MNILEPKLLILASAGSGKTYQLSNRIIGLIAKGADPERIVALTFTRKAAAEFADSMLTKLAKAAADPDAAARLQAELGLAQVDFPAILTRVSRSLHRITLGTMDSFFARIVRAFQYELGISGGRFELIEGPRQEMAADAILEHILGGVFDRPGEQDFPHAFRRASMGREQQGVARNLRDFVARWQGQHRRNPDLEWGPQALLACAPEEWEQHKQELGRRILEGLDSVSYTRKGQRETMEKCLQKLVDHTIASGSLGSGVDSLTASLLEAVATQQGNALTVKSHKEFVIEGPTAEALREMVNLAARCELAAAVLRTRAIREVVSAYDAHCERLLRSRGRLGFDDVKLMMGQWARSEEARLRREAIDFRLDARTDHWLLDEFQDTSRAEWDGLLPLVDEAASDDVNRTMFIVGDRKQAIYAWRGGDVSLFDKVITRYGSGLVTEHLDVSWRSCPQVLALVNRVCGDRPLLERLFGKAGRDWDFPAHHSAPPLCGADHRGHCRVEAVDGWEQKFDRIEEILHQLGVGRRRMTCGVLLRGNETAVKVSNELRSRGFDVILEGQREPGRDNPLGVAVSSLLRWLADPANQLARGVIGMSPLHQALQQRHGESWEAIWNSLSATISADGHQATIRRLVADCAPDISEFGRRRIEDLLHVLGEMDRSGAAGGREVADTIERLSIAQSPGVAAIQVMTIHKSKGLGFDVVILPEIPDQKLPEAHRFKVAQGPDWICETPPAWARRLHPLLNDIEEQWAMEQRHEALCIQYVALTRAKRGLYVLLDPPKTRHDFDKPSLANWMMLATGADAEGADPAFEEGDFSWVEGLPELDDEETRDEETPLVAADVAAGRRASPLSPSRSADHGRHSSSAMAYGLEVHALLEKITWIDEVAPDLPEGGAADAVRRLLENPDTRPLFVRDGRNIRLLREQATDAMIEGRWVSGVIDRLHLHHDASGQVQRVEIIDFKTDAIDDPAALRQAHQQQLHDYRSCIRQIYPDAEIECLLLSTHLGDWIRV